MSNQHFTRSNVHRPNVSDSDEGNVEHDDVAPGAATHLVLETPSLHAPVRSMVEDVGGPESMSAEPAGPVAVRATLSPEEAHPGADPVC